MLKIKTDKNQLSLDTLKILSRFVKTMKMDATVFKNILQHCLMLLVIKISIGSSCCRKKNKLRSWENCVYSTMINWDISCLKTCINLKITIMKKSFGSLEKHRPKSQIKSIFMKNYIPIILHFVVLSLEIKY